MAPTVGQAKGPSDVPPSTLAAQLLHNAAAVDRGSARENRHGFQQLLDDVSQTEDGAQDLEDGPLETKIITYHKCIHLIANEFLKAATKDNPFTSDQQHKQLSLLVPDPLAFLRAIVEEVPEVLVKKPEAENDGPAGYQQQPLWLWLFPKILVLVGRKGFEDVQEKINAFFYAVIDVVSSSTELWNLKMVIFRYLWECCDYTLTHMESLNLHTLSDTSKVNIALPPATVQEFSHPGPGNATTGDSALPESCHYHLRDVASALAHAHGLLCLLCGITERAARAYSPTPAFQDYVSSVFDSLILLQDIDYRSDYVLRRLSGSSDVFSDSLSMAVSLLSIKMVLPQTVLDKGYLVLAELTIDTVEALDSFNTMSDSLLLSLCSSLLRLAEIVRQHASICQTIQSRLLPLLLALLPGDDDNPSSVPRDLQKCILVLRDSCSQSDFKQPEDGFEHAELESRLKGLSISRGRTNSSDEQSRPNKRRKISSPENKLLIDIINVTYSLLGAQGAEDLEGLSQLVSSCFPQLSEPDQCRAMRYLGYMACASAGALSVGRDPKGVMTTQRCSTCDLGQPSQLQVSNISDQAISILREVIKIPAFLESRRPRAFAMISLRSFAAHFGDLEFLNLKTSPLGEWCLHSLKSSLRELRIAAGRALPYFIATQPPSEVSAANTEYALEVLHRLAEKHPLHLQETTVLAWGQMGRIVKDANLNLVLHRLVEYLGHTSSIISALAFNELLNISTACKITPAQMFAPFWRNIAVKAVENLQKRPQIAQYVADLLGISVDALLVETQSYTLPSLVLRGRKNIVHRISKLRGDEDECQVIMDSKNTAQIMALLLMQERPDMESYIVSVLGNISPRFNQSDVDWIRTEPIGIAFELLKAVGEVDDSKKVRIRHAIQFLASRCVSAGDKAHGKGTDQIGRFLETHVLALLNAFFDKINDQKLPIMERQCCLRGLGEMVLLGKGYIRLALPQICAGLHSSLSQDGLRADAFSAWATMVRSLADDDVETILEATFSIIILYWNRFDRLTENQAINIIQTLLDKRPDVIERKIDVLPSLASIEELGEFKNRLEELRGTSDMREEFIFFCARVKHENESVVIQALTELIAYLRNHQSFLQASAVSEQPDKIVGELTRNVLDACVRFNSSNVNIARLSAECIGLIGCLDSNRVEALRERKEVLVTTNFDQADDSTDFCLFTIEHVLLKSFLSATSSKAQGFLSYAIQELLKACGLSSACSQRSKPGDHSASDDPYNKWLSLPEQVQATLTPLLSSAYTVTDHQVVEAQYPIFGSERRFIPWLKKFTIDLLNKPSNQNASLIFPPLRRVIKNTDHAIASYLLPIALLHVVVSGTDKQRKQISQEFRTVLAQETNGLTHLQWEDLRQCSEAIFHVLDYMSRWSQSRQNLPSRARASEGDLSTPETDILRVNQVLSAIPAEVVSGRAVECKSYSRALLKWEQHIRQVRSEKTEVPSPLLERLQTIYAQIDEPDGIEGISAHLHVLEIDQQVVGHRKAGRWTTAQSWYEMKLAETPDDTDVQLNLLTCLKESGQHDVLLNYVKGMQQRKSSISDILPFATEAAWATARWSSLEKYISLSTAESDGHFNVNIGRALLALQKGDRQLFSSTIDRMREHSAQSLSLSTTNSLAGCHDTMLKFHALTELEIIAEAGEEGKPNRREALQALDGRLEVLGSYMNDKQYLLGIRRAAMQLTGSCFRKSDIASAWLTSARLARKGNAMHQSLNAVLHAKQLGDESATIEHARLLWKEGHHRKAIQGLDGAIKSNALIPNAGISSNSASFSKDESAQQQNLLTARAHLMLAKWLDNAGQTQSAKLRSQYQLAAKTHAQWEKGHYYLGRYYNKVMESHRALPEIDQHDTYKTGEMAKLVMENYLRSLSWGTKYIYQTLPRVLTLWLDLGNRVQQPSKAKPDSSQYQREEVKRIGQRRKEQLTLIHVKLQKYIAKLPAYVWYTALPQIVARITHSNPEVYKILQNIITRVVTTYPQQALWSLLAVTNSTQQDRKSRGTAIITTLRTAKKSDPSNPDMRAMIKNGERLVNELLCVCNAGDFQNKGTVSVSITNDLAFNAKVCMPSQLALPVESVLTATLPTITDGAKGGHRPFSRDVVTVQSFLDKVLILSSLARPRKLTARGSDGKLYGLLCKPKDDLRKDQRLMEFNSMINRSLKRDAESSKRQLYIKTYAVTPLNEECGAIEWIDGLIPLRDIILAKFKSMGINPNYGTIGEWLKLARQSDDNLHFFTENCLKTFPPVLHSWFVVQFPEPSSWFNARLKYTRSCAVMSMVGTILGLGDRHGENILLEEGNGGTFHVDFNCLFDKGKTFTQAERVPFRLTHNMVDAMGVYGYEGPFRKSAELTLKLLRQYEETLMTIMEAFIYDPTLDLVPKKDKKRHHEDVPTTGQEVLDLLQRKIRGLMEKENVPLSVEGHVDELIKQATDHKNLAAMYIGWCAFF